MTKSRFIPLLLATCCLLLVVSNNALSHDMFNYMFNAKAVMTYHADPHQRSALEIASQDEWVRFMHNTHTPAPYGYFWTYFSLIPAFFGMGKFVSTYLLFKVWMALGLCVLIYFQWRLVQEKRSILLFLFNPLVLIETLLNGHNDVWMMAFALASFFLISKERKVFSWRSVLSLVVLLLSTQIKLSTFLLIPIWILRFEAFDYYWKILPFLSGVIQRLRGIWAELAVCAMFLPLLTERSQQFHPWYLIWSLSFLPFVRSRLVQYCILAFSLSSLFRYIPFLLVGGYSDAIQWQMRVITWSAIPVALVTFLFVRVFGYRGKTNAK